MSLPKETQDRIEKDADAAASKANDTYRERETQFTNRISFLAGYKEGHIAGATACAERAQKLVGALEWIKIYGPVDDLTIKFIDKALNEWNGAATTDHPCPHCGKELNRDRNLCRECGKEVEG